MSISDCFVNFCILKYYKLTFSRVIILSESGKCNIFGLNSSFIVPVKSSELNQLSKRPSNSFLDCNKIKSDFNLELYTNHSLIEKAFLLR